jgi:hypothetical protein
MHGLGQWLLDMPKFQAWRAGLLEKNILWCPGIPGARKTFLTYVLEMLSLVRRQLIYPRSVIVDHLQMLSKQNHHKILYFYFDYKEQSEQTPFRVFVTLLKQLLSTFDTLPKCALELYGRIERGTRPSTIGRT